MTTRLSTAPTTPSLYWQSDPLLLVSFLLLLLFGISMVASAGIDVSQRAHNIPHYYLLRHAIFMTLGLVAAGVITVLPTAIWRHSSGLILALSIALLLLVLVPSVGFEINGARRWLNAGLFRFQPSELVKAALILYISAYLVRRRDEVTQRWSGFLKPVLILALVVVLLLLEPDFGAVVVLLGTVLGLLFLGGVKAGQFFLTLVAALGAIALMASAESYRMQRLLSFRDPWADENVYGSSYQLTQALIAFGRGEWFGVGLGNSMQKLFYLPEPHNDFIVAIIGEELGLVGTLALVALFSLLISRVFHIGRLAERQGQLFGAFAAYGAGLLLALQGFINIGVNTGLLPTKGLTMPLISYGGTSLIISMALIALVNRVHLETTQVAAT